MTVRLVDDPAELAELFRQDRGSHIYALADLEEPFWSRGRWYRRGDAVVGVISLPGSGATVVYALSTEDPPGTLELLGELAPDLPSGTLITGPLGVADHLAASRGVRRFGPHWKMLLADHDRLPMAEPSIARVVELGSEGIERMSDLYGSDPRAAFFAPAMLEGGPFVGLEGTDGRLLACAGTHVISHRHGVAAIGAVITRPDLRGRGLGTSVVVAVCRMLQARVSVVGLNVAESNLAAMGLYERIGFARLWRYEEVEIVD